ncbi:MAG: hypothetical protein US83_C0010G0005 [Candidatus Falkowbacteria bacterium GW2011_GWC2_38_22]|uniref:Uncharacterized protein n=1 Tax=Candidatus Falkowbacteria bacterium GW2011_GWE1_38_31 TaxID=1618638 RepID=A0A0G0M9C2_9BACT|nr:MAG: hypothetical protein US73_C0005G0005 [Candidatus Falkowbacteria bacterium GW2011_GWF2_38_1205]KKQ60971.1 MAG: hypothetical protein US83_C0010G0005 [Candidatus Falkowbacteria bacterium GW2011_GWC2_38_22]KKQ63500.1 MAG: hypothetical protein US84_C0006G0103 [Candidatus Falkowbacteria bacterium GW2011_GWF1_38_22]KKQ65429.1 MAG: hypothetical protein US87_C0007G0005 [Candidatus Falkowbacteria bacterium GW2011_GWE2_38_254]KKQ70264.1 MAG: hypothetical protein US91_C0006G0103 [Candidatus Falkowb
MVLPERKEDQIVSLEKFSDPNFLPTRDQIIKAFPDWHQWFEFCFNKENPTFEFLNNEYLESLTEYFIDKNKEYGTNKNEPLVILEIGAGNGRLSHFLQQKLDSKIPRQTKVIATDSGAWTIKNDFLVEQLNHNEAIEKYNPKIVIFSWMPYQEDSSKDIRKFKSVQEYILIGETDGGCCGDEWETWGQSWREEDLDKTVPPYEADGFERIDLDDVSELQICRCDEPGNYYHSRTVSFKRKK